MQAFLTEVVRVRDIGRTIKNLVGLVLISQLRGLGFPGLEFDGDRHAVDHIGTFEQDTKGTFAYFFADLIMQTDDGRVISGGVAVGVGGGRGGH